MTAESGHLTLNRAPAARADTAKNKAALRQYALELRAELNEKFRAQASALACERFLHELPVPEGAAVALYWPMGDELDCRELISALRARGHPVCLPAIIGPDRPLVFRLWEDAEELAPGPFGTSEPEKSAPEIVPDLVVLPLLGFDKQGNRLGYGKGYYDRTIAAMDRQPLLVGLAFGVQELEHIPASPHDVPLHMAVTEDGLRRFEKEGEAT